MTGLIRGEFAKLFTTKLWLWLLLGAVAMTAFLIGVTIALSGAAGNPNPPLGTPQGQRNLFAMAGSSSALAIVLGIIAMTGEYRHQTVTPVFLATPRRARVVVAKLIAYAIAGIGLGVANVLVTIAIAVPWLSAEHIDVALTQNGIPRTLAGSLAGLAIYTVLGVAIGALVRNQVAAVVGTLVYLLVVEALISALPNVRDYYKFFPGGAFNGLLNSTAPNVHFLGPWESGLLLIGYAVALAALGTALTIRRDIT